MQAILNNFNMFQRTLSERLVAAACKMPVVTLVGPRQSGKTTLVRAVFPDHRYLSLERPDDRAEALEDPRGFLARFENPVILDEVQRAPELLSYIQVDVDEDDRPGRFILSGSQNLLLMEKISQTLAGRTAILHLLPLSTAELCGRPPVDIDILDKIESKLLPPPDLDIWKTIWTGFYPRIHDKNLDPMSWLADYHRTYVERDLRDVLKVMDLDLFERFVRLTAARTGQVLNIASLSEDVGVTQPTAKRWLTALRISFIITLFQPHHASFRKRLRKSPKLHFIDTGLACYLLGIKDPEILSYHPLRGAIFESYVAGELMKGFSNIGLEHRLYHWRDSTGHEIDILIDLGDRLIPVEAKSGMTITSDTVTGLRWWTDLERNPAVGGVVVHGGDESRMRNGIAIRPWYLG